MKNTRCHLCEAKDLQVSLAGPPVVLRCRACGLRFLEEFPAAGERHALYQGEYYDDRSGDRFFAPLELFVRAFRRLRARQLIRHLPPAREKTPPNALLDVGCGRGLLLEELQARGWRVTGTQVSETARRACERRLGRGRALAGELPDLALERGAYRAVTFYHVLEHLPRPLDYLEEAGRLLHPDGLLVIEVPDASGPGARLLRGRDFCLDYPHHLYFFTPATLKRMVERAGFEVAGVARYSLEYSPFTCLQNLLNALPGEPNRFYRSLRRNADGRRLRRSPWTWLHAALAVLLAGPAFALSLSGLFLPLGNTLRFYCRKKVPARGLSARPTSSRTSARSSSRSPAATHARRTSLRPGLRGPG
jgi:SAM-dependent methyltransferase